MPRKTAIRLVPADEALAARSRKLRELGQVPHDGGAPLLGLEPGNTKIGKHSETYGSVFVWNLPAVGTCPGASSWCMTWCYNGQDRTDTYRDSEWLGNLQAFERDPASVKRSILRTLDLANPPTAIRIHSSGDFYSPTYIRFWTDLATRRPEVDVWAYTRSWSVPELLSDLETLRSLPNVQLFASWDPTMAAPPDGWRLSVVSEDGSPPEVNAGMAKMLRCPEETKLVADCASCGHCIQPDERGVWFTAH